MEILLGNVGDTFLELLAPLLLDVQTLRLVLLWLEVPVKQSLKLLPILLLTQGLLLDGWNILVHFFRNRVLLLVTFGRSASC